MRARFSASPVPVRAPRRLTRRALAGAVAAGVGGPLLVAACGPVDATGRRYTVQMTLQDQFDPASLVVPHSSVVSWKNIGARPQSVTTDPRAARSPDHAAVPRGVAPWDSPDLYPGAVWSLTFDTPGTYVYFSRYHEDQQMIGTITVLEPGAHATPTAGPQGTAGPLLSTALPQATPPPAPTPGKTPLPTPPAPVPTPAATGTAGTPTAATGGTR